MLKVYLISYLLLHPMTQHSSCGISSSCGLKPHSRPNEFLQKLVAVFFLPIIIAGYFFPWIGLSIFACMIAGLGISFSRGRKWCDWYCPRGSFLDVFLSPFSPQRKLPAWFYTYSFRLTFIGLLFSFLTFNVYYAYPDLSRIGFAFVKTLTITTILSIILAYFYRARGWCVVCPVGTFSGLIGGTNTPLKVDYGKCLNCTTCERVCPMGLVPYKDKKNGILQSKDCIKCGTCIANCPSGALSFSSTKKQ